MHWTALTAAILFGAAVTLLTAPEPPPVYEGEWRVSYVRTVPSDQRPVTKIQKPHVVERAEDLCIERFSKLPALTERLKVPETADSEPSVVIEMCDGRKWDVFDILQALLDRMEQK